MLLINHPPLGPESPTYLKTLAALQAISDSPSAFFTTGAPGDAEREELILGTQLFDLPVARRGYLYLLRSCLGKRAPTLMTAAQLGKQQLLAAQLFAEARNAFAKAGQAQEELIAFYLSVRCALHSEVELPSYLDEMSANYAKAAGGRAETLAYERLTQHDLPGFLAMTTIAFSAYEDNAVPLGQAELKRYSGLTLRSLTHLHEYLKAHAAKLPATDAAMVQRSMALMAAAHPAHALPAWLQEVVDRAPSRAATAFLQEAAAQDKKRKMAVSAWWWAHAAEVLSCDADFEDWHHRFKGQASTEAAKRLGERAVKEREARKDVYTYTLLTSHTNKMIRNKMDIEPSWLTRFRDEEPLNVQSLLKIAAQTKASSGPLLSPSIDVLLYIDMRPTSGVDQNNTKVYTQYLNLTTERLAGETVPQPN